MDRSANTCAGICGSPPSKKRHFHIPPVYCVPLPAPSSILPFPILSLYGERGRMPQSDFGVPSLSLPPSSVRAPNWKTEAEEEEASLPPGRREGGRRRRSDRIGGKRRRSRKEKKKLCFPLSSFSLADVPHATVVFGDCFSSPSCLRFLPFFRPAKLNQPLICAAKRNKGLQGRANTNTCVCFTLLRWCKYCFAPYCISPQQAAKTVIYFLRSLLLCNDRQREVQEDAAASRKTKRTSYSYSVGT